MWMGGVRSGRREGHIERGYFVHWGLIAVLAFGCWGNTPDVGRTRNWWATSNPSRRSLVARHNREFA